MAEMTCVEMTNDELLVAWTALRPSVEQQKGGMVPLFEKRMDILRAGRPLRRFVKRAEEYVREFYEDRDVLIEEHDVDGPADINRAAREDEAFAARWQELLQQTVEIPVRPVPLEAFAGSELTMGDLERLGPLVVDDED